MQTLNKLFATAFGLGYLPKAPGTFGTLAGVLLFYATHDLSLINYSIFVIVFIVFAIWVADGARTTFNSEDPKQVVIDEVAGFLVTMIGHSWDLRTVIAGFVLFRIFDILKPFPCGLFDKKLKGGLGIVMDDVMAGVYANVGVFVIGYLISLL